ncbi:MAG: hypothetical protein V3U26_01610 [Dehalococcoidia bacterium]
MANVRIDENGVPKGPAFDTTPPQAHRSSVSAVDASDPADASGGVDCAGYKYCRFDVTITGTGFTSLDVQVLFWNPRQGLWFGGASRQFTATGQYALAVPDVRGSIVFLKVTAFSGTSFSLGADYALS